jgi:PAS domain S-box-containing protein
MSVPGEPAAPALAADGAHAAAEALRFAEDRCRLVIDQSPISVQVVSPDGRTLQANAAFERLWGVTLDDLRDYNILQDPQLWENGVRPHLDRAFAGEAAEIPPVPYVPDRGPRKGEPLWVRARAYAVKDDRGAVREVVLMHEDITRQRRAEDELRYQKSLLEAQSEASIDGILVVSTEGRILSSNRRFAEMWGIPADVLAAGSDDAALRHVRDRLAEPGEFMWRVKELYRYPDEYSREEVSLKDGRTFDRFSAPVHAPGGGLYGRVWFFRDVTDRRRAVDGLREMAEHNRLLASEVNHRVGNNLASLLALVAEVRGRAADVESFAAAIEGRLRGMARVHRLLGEGGWSAVELRTLVLAAAEAMEPLAPHRAALTAEGPSLLLGAGQALPLMMTLVEWFANSGKHGAHSVPGGAVEVRWSVAVDGDGTRPMARLAWREHGGPPVAAPVAPSLGTELVTGFVTRELRGRCRLGYPREGADHEIEFPAQAGERVGP